MENSFINKDIFFLYYIIEYIFLFIEFVLNKKVLFGVKLEFVKFMYVGLCVIIKDENIFLMIMIDKIIIDIYGNFLIFLDKVFFVFICLFFVIKI